MDSEWENICCVTFCKDFRSMGKRCALVLDKQGLKTHYQRCCCVITTVIRDKLSYSCFVDLCNLLKIKVLSTVSVRFKGVSFYSFYCENKL